MSRPAFSVDLDSSTHLRTAFYLREAGDEHKAQPLATLPCSNEVLPTQRPRPPWCPISLRTPFLTFIILVSLAFTALLQSLLHTCQQHGGVAFTMSTDTHFTFGIQFAYKYLPTILAVIYGLLWAWVDLDVRRIEPFLQMSKTDGERGEHSLLLHYPVDFLASVPVKAFRNRHWSVFVASMATVLVVWGIVPVQSGIFATDLVTVRRSSEFQRSTGYLSLDQQRRMASAQAAQTASNILWLNQSLPLFMTEDYVLAPFWPRAQAGPVNNSSWTGPTTLYSVDLACETAVQLLSATNATITNSTWGCSYLLPPPRTGRQGDIKQDETKVHDSIYVGYHNEDGSADYYLSDGSCPPSASQTFLAQWSKALIPVSDLYSMDGDEQRLHSDVTAIWCQSHYYTMEVNATINFGPPVSYEIQGLSPPAALSPEIFNISAFEAAMSMGHDLNQARTTYPVNKWPDQTGYLQDLPLNLYYVPNMVPFAIGATQRPLDQYLNASELAESYQSAYRLLFASRMYSILQSETNSTAIGHLTQRTQALILDATFTRIVQGLLISAAALATIILQLVKRRDNKLGSDPSAISALMSLVADDTSLLGRLGQSDQHTDRELSEYIRHQRFELHQPISAPEVSKLRLVPEPSREDAEGYGTLGDGNLHKDEYVYEVEERRDRLNALKPYELRLATGVSFITLQLFVGVLIVWVMIHARNDYGIALPSESRFVRQLVENYLPTAVGTLIGPIWLVLARHLCMIQPFEMLRQGGVRASESLEVTISAVPSQFAVIQAFRLRFWLLGLLCIMNVLSDGLSVALAGLLNEVTGIQHGSPISVVKDHELALLPLNGSATAFTGNTGQLLEAFYIASSSSNISWVEGNFFFQPIELPNSFIDPVDQVQFPTQALYSNLSCWSLPIESNFSIASGQYSSQTRDTLLPTVELTVRLVDDNGKAISCIPRSYVLKTTGTIGRDESIGLLWGHPTGPSAFEFMYALDGEPGAAAEDARSCRQHFSAGWVRAVLTNGSLPSNHSIYNPPPVPTIVDRINSTIVVCRPQVKVRAATVRISPAGFVAGVKWNTTLDDGQKFDTPGIPDLIAQAHQYIITRGMTWHNDSFPSDFANYLISQMTKSTHLLDPALGPPSVEEIIAPLSELYGRLFAIFLGRNYDALLVPSNKTSKESARVPVNASADQGMLITPTTRIFVSPVLSIMALTILGIYLITTVWLYSQRPWRILCRMPTSPASIIAYFAASHAVNDFKSTTSAPQFAAPLGALLPLAQHKIKAADVVGDRTYGFGTFIGTDGKVHVGIERDPFVAKLLGAESESRPDGWKLNLKARYLQWRHGTVREGGWI